MQVCIWDAINEGCGSSCYLQSGRVRPNPIRMTEISTIYQPHRQATTPTPSSRPPGATVVDTSTNGSPGGGSRGCGNQQGRAFQIRQGSFKLNALRLPSTVSRFVIMQVIFSCVCATLGILSVAFRCWMAYLCIPVIVGAMVGGAFIDLFKTKIEQLTFENWAVSLQIITSPTSYKRPIYIGKTKIQKTWVFLLYRLHCQKNP